ncbi:MAG: NAD-dependent DNA ligase LigA [Polyangiaceae bacterium]|nr:NAD-dependent DNA ligase LigA [Polyangiaceae bacterium]
MSGIETSANAPEPESAVTQLEGGIEVDPRVRARVEDLASRVERYRASYYAGKPEISDAAYDALEDELRALAPAHPVLARVGSGALVTEWEKARHEIPMGSLNKVTNDEELRAWVLRCDELLAKEGQSSIKNDLFVAEKLDGISIELVYRDGKLADAITRGDGFIGERITSNVARMKGVPARIADKRPISVRGEIILCLSDMKKNFPIEYTSPRNTAAGTAKRFDGQGAEHLTVLFYDVADHFDIPTEEAKFAWLRSLGFATPHTAKGTVEDVLALYGRYEKTLRAQLDYEIDGLVVYACSMAAQTTLGELNRRPRGATAFKFSSPAKVSKVVEIRWDTGPSGRVTPVAIVEPVELAGATVQRASLHNAGLVRALGIGVGDEVLVSRRNDVIPYVEEVIESAGHKAVVPENCSTCGAPLSAEGEYLMCRNIACTAVVEGRIHAWIDAIGALEWGDKLISQLVAAGKLREPRDLYLLTWEDIAALERRGEKSAKKCIEQIKSRLPVTLPVFLAGLGIEGFAQQTARLLVSAGLTTIDAVVAATPEQLASISGLGPIKAASIARGLAARKDEIERLRQAGVEPTPPEAQGALAGLTFCFTGSATRPRGELTREIESRGGRVLGSVTKELQYLVIADVNSTSSKAEKARKLGTKLINEDQMLELIADKEREHASKSG